MTWRRINLNDNVKVKLTSRGNVVLQEYQDHWKNLYPGKFGEHYSVRWEADGWSRWKLNELMLIFGRYMESGLEYVMETTLYVEEE